MPVVAGAAVRSVIRATVRSAVVTGAGAVVAPAAVVTAPVAGTVAVEDAVGVAFSPVHVEAPDRVPELAWAPVVRGRRKLWSRSGIGGGGEAEPAGGYGSGSGDSNENFHKESKAFEAGNIWPLCVQCAVKMLSINIFGYQTIVCVPGPVISWQTTPPARIDPAGGVVHRRRGVTVSSRGRGHVPSRRGRGHANRRGLRASHGRASRRRGRGASRRGIRRIPS